MPVIVVRVTEFIDGVPACVASVFHPVGAFSLTRIGAVGAFLLARLAAVGAFFRAVSGGLPSLSRPVGAGLAAVLLPGSSILLPGARFALPGARFALPGARFALPGARFALPGTLALAGPLSIGLSASHPAAEITTGGPPGRCAAAGRL